MGHDENDQVTADGGGSITTDRQQTLADALGIVTFTKDLQIPSIPWQVDGLWPEQSLGLTTGLPKVGKSWVSMDQAVSYATGTNHLGREVRAKGPVIYFLGEDHMADVQERVDLLLAGRGLGRDALEDRLRFSDATINLESPDYRELILTYVQEIKPLLVVFDPLARFLSESDENSAKDLRPIINWWRQDLVRIGKTSVNVVHHTDKSGRTARGTGDLLGMVNVEIGLKGQPAAGHFTIQVTPRRGRAPEPFRVNLVVKNNGAVLKVTGTPESVGAVHDFALLERGRQALKDARWGVSVNQFSEMLNVRWGKAKQVLIDLRAVEIEKHRWRLPDADDQTTKKAAGE